MLPVSQDELRVLMAKGDSHHPELLALIQELAPSATVDFVLPHYHLYSVYETRLEIAQQVSGDWYEGLQEAVESMATSSLATIRLLEIECREGSCVLFVEEHVQEVLGIIYFPE